MCSFHTWAKLFKAMLQGIFCAGNDAVFDLLTDVLDEVIALFPGTYIHIGGDEVPKENWGLRGGQPASEIELGFKVEV